MSRPITSAFLSPAQRDEYEAEARDYAALESQVARRVGTMSGPLFTADVPDGALWDAYMKGLPAHRRQHYQCHACRHFIGRYGPLVTIDAEGRTTSALWPVVEAVPDFFRPSVAWMRDMVHAARVSGVFVTDRDTWGSPVTGEWTHLAGAFPHAYRGKVKRASEVEAERREDYGILQRSLADYPLDAVRQALRVLESGAAYRSEKALGVAKWLVALHESIARVKGRAKNNLVWLAVATAPPGFCHVRTTVISTLLDDIVAGVPFDTLAARWGRKLDPLVYQRPQAPPRAGNIDEAEKLVEKLGVARSLERRVATLDDVLAKLWVPRPFPASNAPQGVFGHLREPSPGVAQVEISPVTMTWEKFARTVLGDALAIECRAPAFGAYYGLVTAMHADAPAILQWDGLEGEARNPVSWYFYASGSIAHQWGLAAGAWVKVNAVFVAPFSWQRPEKFRHHGDKVMFALDGARDGNRNAGLALFPECLKTEFRGIRSVIEAHSAKGVLGQPDEAATLANGVALQAGAPKPLELRVTTAGGVARYTIDRWD